jgi:hypothetical protein
MSEHGSVPLLSEPEAVAEAITSFFAKCDVACLRLQSGWFGGRPFDNLLKLTGISTEGGSVRVALDETQVLTLDADTASLDGSLLRVTISAGSWDWIEYGTQRHCSEALGPGNVEFHSPVRL